MKALPRPVADAHPSPHGPAPCAFDDARTTRYAFGDGYVCDADLLELWQHARSVPLEAKPMRVLLHLIRQAPRIVPVEELLREVWPGVRVSSASVKTAVYELRRVFARDGRGVDPIESHRGRGYRFRAPFERLAGSPPDPTVEPALGARRPQPPARAALTDGRAVSTTLRAIGILRRASRAARDRRGWVEAVSHAAQAWQLGLLLESAPPGLVESLLCELEESVNGSRLTAIPAALGSEHTSATRPLDADARSAPRQAHAKLTHS